MGWAKFFEDNMEIAQDRLYMKYHSCIETNTASSGDSKITIIPQIVVQILPTAATVETERQDRQLVCKDCGEKFVFNVKAQEYYAQQGWSHPKRCRGCREIKKLRRLIYSA